MGNNHAKIKTAYYDKYFGPDYFKTVGDDIGEKCKFNGIKSPTCMVPCYYERKLEIKPILPITCETL